MERSLSSDSGDKLNYVEEEPSPPIRKVVSDEWNGKSKYNTFGFAKPLSISWFFSVLGAEYCHTYFWIAKDLAWMQSWRHFSIFFGLMALAWSQLILYHAMRTLNWHELWNFVALFLWLFANFWWMIGEAHDYEYPDEYPISIEHSDTCAHILEFAFVWVLLYYVVILPCNLLQRNKASLAEYDDRQLKPRWSCFKNFREYENLHMLFWIAKDLSWNKMNLVMWLICLVPTMLISADFIIISATTPCDDTTVDIVHFTVSLMWVFGNSVWAFGDFFFDDYDEPIRMWIRSEISLRTARWYSSWILFSAVVPVLAMYGVWGTLTLTGRLRARVDGRGGTARAYGGFENVGAPNWIEIQDIDGQAFSDGAPSMDTSPVSFKKISGGSSASTIQSPAVKNVSNNNTNNSYSSNGQQSSSTTGARLRGNSLTNSFMNIISVAIPMTAMVAANGQHREQQDDFIVKEPDEHTGLLEMR